MAKHISTVIVCEQTHKKTVPTEFKHGIVNDVLRTLGHCPECAAWHVIDFKISTEKNGGE